MTARKILILRHDIDISPDLANSLLDVELDLGLRSTIFVRTGAPGYDLSEPETAATIVRFVDEGFEIGIHYEIPRDELDVVASLVSQKNQLERAIGADILGAAPHRVATIGRGVTAEHLEAAGLQYDAFVSDQFSSFKYLSDSRRRWREGCFCGWVDRAETLQVLTHPVWWRRGSLSRMDEILALL